MGMLPDIRREHYRTLSHRRLHGSALVGDGSIMRAFIVFFCDTNRKFPSDLLCASWTNRLLSD